MGLFQNKKKELIPPVENPSGKGGARTPSPNSAVGGQQRSAAPTYVPPSQGGSGYTHETRYGREGKPYGRDANGGSYNARQQSGYGSRDASNGYSAVGAAGGKTDNMRSELLSGARPLNRLQSQSSNDPYDPSSGDGQVQAQTEEDEDVEGIKRQIKQVKNDTLFSARNARRIAMEAEETARATLDKLGEQSDRIANTERHLDMAKAHNDRAQDQAKELKALNRSIFRPTMTFNKSAKRDAEERRILARHAEEQGEREETRREQYESRERIAGTYRTMDRMAENSAITRSKGGRPSERSRYQFEATESDEEVENDIDSNLDDVSDVVGRLKQLAGAMGDTVDQQNKHIDRLHPKVQTLDTKITANTARLARIK